MECLSWTQLFKYLKSQINSNEHIIISSHLFLLEGCQVCQENLQWLERVIKSAAEDDSFEFSEEKIAAIVARVKEKEQIQASQQPIRQYLAKLIFDSGVPLQLAEARLRMKKFLVRRMRYQAEGYDIDLKFTWFNKSNDERLDGQILTKHCDVIDPAQFKIELLQHDSVASATTTNTHGEFMFAQLTSGIYDLKVFVPDGKINLERVPTAGAL